MGLLILPDPPPPEYGDDCAICYPIGETPLKLYIIFSGMTICPEAEGAPLPPNNKTFEMEQAFETPCGWGGVDGNWFFDYSAAVWDVVGYSKVNLRTMLWGDYFDIPPRKYGICQISFINWLVCGIGGIAASGGVAVIFTLRSVTEVAALVNIQPSARLKAEVLPVSAEHTVFQFWDKPLGINIKIKREV